jgi:predicted RNA binding protein YcfA (HicA-like mRNA interferase family)
MYDAHAARHLSSAVHPGLEGDGFVLQRVRERHRIYRHADGRRVVAAYHALSGSFPIGTLRRMIADAGWRDEDLRDLGLLD